MIFFIVLTEVQSNMIIVMWRQFSHIPSMTVPYILYIIANLDDEINGAI